MKKIKKVIFLLLGLIGLVLGTIGAFLPILPTVPFLLLAGFGFAKSSERLDKWFKSTKLYKKNLESFVRGEGMSVGTKIRIIIIVTILMVVGFIMMDGVLIGRICLGIVWIAHIIAFVFIIKTKKKESVNQEQIDDSQKEISDMLESG